MTSPSPRPAAVSALAFACALAAFAPASAQVIGSYDNFDCFNDTGTEAEGFEIDVEDIDASALIREFPSNFSSTPWVIRYGLPTVTPYDFRTASPDPQHSYDGGHKGVLIVWAAKYVSGKWVADYGHQVRFGVAAGNGTPYVKNPSYTAGDSCWFYGLGGKYPSSGCDHFGISFAPGVAIGKQIYHWKIADPANPGTLINAQQEASLPPTPGLTYVPPVRPGVPPVVNVVAEGPPDNADPAIDPNTQYGDAYWLKNYTSYQKARAQLDALQKNQVPMKNGGGVTVVVSWALVQRPPLINNGELPEKKEVENDPIPANAVGVTKRTEYYRYAGAYDPDTHEAICGPEGPNSNGPCSVPVGTYQWTDPNTGVTATYHDLGKFIGAHMNAYNIK